MTEAVTGHRPVSSAWSAFHERLTETLRAMTEDIAMPGALGWDDPTSGPGLTPREDPDGSPNHFREWATPVDHVEIATLTVRTLLEVHDAAHPGWLAYRSFDSDGGQRILPGSGLQSA